MLTVDQILMLHKGTAGPLTNVMLTVTMNKGTAGPLTTVMLTVTHNHQIEFTW